MSSAQDYFRQRDQFTQFLEFIRTVYTGKCRRSGAIQQWTETKYLSAVRKVALKIAYGANKCKLDFSELGLVHEKLAEIHSSHA